MSTTVEVQITCYITHGVNRCTIKLPQSDVNDMVLQKRIKLDGQAKGKYPTYQVMFWGTWRNLWIKYGVVL